LPILRWWHFNFWNSRVHLHELTISIARTHFFNFMNSAPWIEFLNLTILTSWSSIHEVEFVLKSWIPVKLKSWICEFRMLKTWIQFMKLELWTLKMKFGKTEMSLVRSFVQSCFWYMYICLSLNLSISNLLNIYKNTCLVSIFWNHLLLILGISIQNFEIGQPTVLNVVILFWSAVWPGSILITKDNPFWFQWCYGQEKSNCWKK
jgi:hypothetical protein